MMRTVELLAALGFGLWLYGRGIVARGRLLGRMSGPAVPSEESGRASSILHSSPCMTNGEYELLEFPVVAGWDEDAILSCVAEIEAL